MLIYGTDRERKELAALKRYFGDAHIVNPNGDVQSSRSMVPFLEAVERSDVVAFSDVDGWIGRGVYTEVHHAHQHDKTLFHIGQQTMNIVAFTGGVRVANRDDWKYRYAKVVTNNLLRIPG